MGFVYLFDLWFYGPNQHIKIMSSMVSYPIHTTPGHSRLPKQLTINKHPYFLQVLLESVVGRMAVEIIS